MKKTLSRYGNSLALIIDKPILELLNIKEDTVLHIKTDGEKLTITPEAKIKKEVVSRDPKLRKVIKEVMEEFSEEFKKLADS